MSDEMTPAEALSERVAALTAEVQRLRGQQSKVIDEAITATFRECERCEFPEGGGHDWDFDRKKVKAAIHRSLSLITHPAADTEGK